MDPFVDYLVNAKNFVESIAKTSNQFIHIVIGNESCDLDSTVSTLVYAYFLHECVYNNSEPLVAVIPVLNVNADDFPTRTENCYALKQVGLELNTLIFRNQLNFDEILKNGTLRVSLVDHHVLTAEEQVLAESVVQVIDHRPIDPHAQWDSERVNVIIKEVGSCASLVANEVLKCNDEILYDMAATLLYYTIIFDTICLSHEAGKSKKLDYDMVFQLEGILQPTKDRSILFDELWAAHNDVSSLTPHQLLSKDLKFVEGIAVPGLPMLIEQYLELPDVVPAMSSFCKLKQTSLLVLMGLEASKGQVIRDLALFNDGCDNEILQALVKNLNSTKDSKGFDLCLDEVDVNIPSIIYYKQGNVQHTRKQILPVIKETLIQCYKR